MRITISISYHMKQLQGKADSFYNRYTHPGYQNYFASNFFANLLPMIRLTISIYFHFTQLQGKLFSRYLYFQVLVSIFQSSGAVQR